MVSSDVLIADFMHADIMEFSPSSVELAVAALLDAVLDAELTPCCSRVHIDVRLACGQEVLHGRQTELSDWSNPPAVRILPQRASHALHTVILLDVDGMDYCAAPQSTSLSQQDPLPSHPPCIALLWARANLCRSSVEDRASELQPFVPHVEWAGRGLRRLLVLCCEQTSPLCADALQGVASTWGAPMLVRPSTLWSLLGLHVVGLRCATVGAGGSPAPAEVHLQREGVGASWREAWGRGGCFLEWMLLGTPLAARRPFAPINVGADNLLGYPAFDPSRVLEYAAVATGWHAASLLEVGAAAAGGSDEFREVVKELQLLTEAAAVGDTRKLEKAEARLACRVCAHYDIFPGCS